MRTPTILVAAGALATALLAAGCGGAHEHTAGATGELLLRPAAARGPNPFTRSAATMPPPVTRTPQRDPAAPGIVSGGMPGLYGGTVGVGSCDVERQIGDLDADPSRRSAFARISGVSPASVPGHLRELAPVVLRADTRVTEHAYRGGRASGHQSVLQAGTAVLVDDRGVPRVRCASGSPLTPPAAMRGGAVPSGRPWPGYRPGRVIVVVPSEQVITELTIIDLVDHAWIERRIDHDCRHDHAVPPPTPTPEPPAPTAPNPPRETVPHRPVPSPAATSPGTAPSTCPPHESCPAPTQPAVPPADTRPTAPDTETVPTAPDTETVPDTPGADLGPATVPDTPDLPDGGGLIPDDPDDPGTSPGRTTPHRPVE